MKILKKIFRYTSYILILLVVVIAGGLFWLQSDHARLYIASLLSEEIGREVRLEKPIHLAFASDPKLIVNGLTLVGSDWGTAKPLFTVDEGIVTLSFSPLFDKNTSYLKALDIKKASVFIEHREDGKRNWDFVKNEPKNPAPQNTNAAACFTLPTTSAVAISDFTISFLPANAETYVLHVDNFVFNPDPMSSKVDTSLQGTINEQAISIVASMQQSETLSLKATINQGTESIALNGTVKERNKHCALDFSIDAHGENLQKIGAPYRVSLPSWGPYRYKGDYSFSGKAHEFKKLDLTQGESHIRGSLNLTPKDSGLGIQATLDEAIVILKDLVAAGAEGKESSKSPEKPSEFVFSESALPFETLANLDLNVSIANGTFSSSPETKLEDIAATFKTSGEQILLTVENAKFNEGTFKGSLTVSAPKTKAETALSLNASGLNLTKITGEKSLQGELSSEINLRAAGNSLHSIASSANGKAKLFVENGKFSNDILKLLSAGLYDIFAPIFGNIDSDTLHCIVSGFEIKDGNATSLAQLFHSDSITVIGEGSINLANEKLDLDFRTESSKPSLASLMIPFSVGGKLAKPSFVPNVIGAAGELVQAPTTLAVGTVSTIGNAIGSVVMTPDEFIEELGCTDAFAAIDIKSKTQQLKDKSAKEKEVAEQKLRETKPPSAEQLG